MSVVLCLLAVVAVAAGLRFHGIRAISPILADEADYILEARYVYSAIRGVCNSLLLKLEEARTGRDLWQIGRERSRIKEQMMGRSPYYARPGQTCRDQGRQYPESKDSSPDDQEYRYRDKQHG